MSTQASDKTSANTDALEVKPGLKIVCPIIGIFISICATYIMVSLFVHCVSSRRQAKELRAKQLKEQGSVRSRPRSRGVARLSAWLGYLSVASSIFAFLNCLSDHALLYLQETSNTTCKIMQGFSYAFYPCGVCCVYSFLWVRQRVFYSSPTLGILHSKYLRWTSFAILPVFLSLMLVGMITTLAIYTYETSPIGCIETSGNKSPKIVLYVAALFMQAALLGLFVYPLKQHANSVDDVMPENQMILSLIKRACVTTGICVLADTVAFIIIMVLPTDGPCIVVNLIRDGNLVVNVICIICSFVDWKVRLGSICCKVEDKDSKSDREFRVIKSSIKSDSLMATPQTTQKFFRSTKREKKQKNGAETEA